MNDNVHPLRAAYLAALRRMYNRILQGDKNPKLTLTAAKKIAELGLCWDDYMDAAMKICGPTAKFLGMPYPYYNLVVGDKTIARIQAMLGYTRRVQGEELAEECLFEYELVYATAYLDWWLGNGEKPMRTKDVPAHIKSQVAEHLCKTYGVRFTTSNYNAICKAVEHNGQ